MTVLDGILAGSGFRLLRSLRSRLATTKQQALTSPAAIWVLSAALVLVAAALFDTGAGGARPIVASVRIPFWALLLGFAAAERFVVHVHFRHSAHSMSLGEIPLVFGLLFATGHDVIIAAALGRLAVLVAHRRLPPVRVAFNLGSFLLWSCVAVLVLHAVTGPAGADDPVMWAAVALATGAASLVTALLIGAAVSISEGRIKPRQVLTTLWTDLTVSVATASVALCAVTLLVSDSTAGVLMVVPAAGMFVLFRAYVAERQRHERLEFLYDAARTLSRTGEIGCALERLLAQAIEAFRAEVAELIFFSPDGNDAVRTSVRANGATRVLESVEPGIASELRALIEQRGQKAYSLAEIADGRLPGYLESRGMSAGLFAALNGEHSWIGAILLGNPSGVVQTFSDDDLKLLETLADNTSVALENDRRGQTLWRMKAQQRQLEHQASHDPLTDLANRALFLEHVRANLHVGSVSVIFIDLDDFKTVNDSLGHAAGDQLLVAIAHRMRECVRPSDVVARLGGDEFAVMLDGGCSADEPVEVAERIIRGLAQRFTIDKHSVSVRASAGIATANDPNVAEELIRNADMAMYQAKRAGKHGYARFERGMEGPIFRRHGLTQRDNETVNASAR